MSEFEETLKKLNGCINTIKCGCSVTPVEVLYAVSIYYRCREYMQAYDEAKFGESHNLNKL